MANLGPNPYNAQSSDPMERRRANEWIDAGNRNIISQAGIIQPAFAPATDANGVIKSQYQLTPGQINYSADTSGLDALKARALQTGPSAWLNMALGQNDVNTNNNLSSTASQSAGNQANAESNLAMRGGLSSGARERVAKNAMTSGNAASQAVRSGGANTAANLGMQDEQTKTSLLSQLPGAQLAQGAQNLGVQEFNVGQKTAADQYNIGNSLSDLLQKRAYDANTYNQQMKAWAAGKSADAQGGGGKK